MKTTYFLLLLIVAFNCATVFSQNPCPYCHGTGKIVRHTTSSSPLELKEEEKTRCEVCGEYTYPSLKHCHAQCAKCHGKGRLASLSTSNKTQFNPEVYGLNTSISYGLPFSEEECTCFDALCKENEENAKHYAEWRNILNFATQYFKQSLQMHKTKGVSVQEVDKLKAGWDKKLAKKSKSYYLTKEMEVIVNELIQQYTSAYNDYRYSVTKQHNADEINRCLFQM